MIDRIKISNFKKVLGAELPLGSINVLVGGNNSGKSCLLQGVHFGIALSQARKIAGFEQFPPEQLRYCPTDEFLNLRHGRRLTEGASIDFEYARTDAETGQEEVAIVRLQRGRNGVVKAVTEGQEILDQISDPKGFFSIYVPGLAGVSIREEYRSDLVVNNGIARGDANLYLRNVLHRIEMSEERRDKFLKYLDQVFPGCRIQTNFNHANDLWIRSVIILDDGSELPLDMMGTGLLQTVQLFAYVTNYEPKILLLDEPDAHLHPKNQRLLAKALGVIAESSDTKILMATHSRHLLDALSEIPSAKLYWVRNGSADHHAAWSDVAVLMDLGALDRGEEFLAGNYRYLVWTEDTDTEYLLKLLEANGANMEETLVFSYLTSSKIDAASLMASFVGRIRPGVRLIIHRDRDFMTDDEVQRMIRRYGIAQGQNIKIFITSKNDVEGYFVQPEHLHHVLGISLVDARTLVETTVQESLNEFVLKFRDKREEIKRDLYKADPDDCPGVAALLPGNNVPIEKALGKILLKRLSPKIQQLGRNAGDVLVVSEALEDQALQDCLR